jgi:hypothetical protein
VTAKKARGRRSEAGRPSAIALAVERADWERVALLVLIGVARAARDLPQASVEDVLALLEEGARDDRAR